MLLNAYKLCLQNVETDYLEKFENVKNLYAFW